MFNFNIVDVHNIITRVLFAHVVIIISSDDIEVCHKERYVQIEVTKKIR